VSGDIEGKAPSVTIAGGHSSTATPPSSYIMMQNDELWVRAYTDAATASGVSGSVELALIFTLPSSQYAGTVYCAGAGSTWTAGNGTLLLSLASLSKLGECVAEPGAATLRACL
jgi:hypothetical protein